MSYYVFVENEKIRDKGQCPEILKEGVLQFEVTEDVYNNIEKYIYKNNEIVLDPDYEEKQLIKTKEQKLNEASNLAYDYIENYAVYQDVECTDNNIAKFDALARGFDKGYLSEVLWTTKSDNLIRLNKEDIDDYLIHFQLIQSEVWNVKYLYFKKAIEEAKTIEEIQNIEINYESEV